jgi:hypothetical protein
VTWLGPPAPTPQQGHEGKYVQDHQDRQTQGARPRLWQGLNIERIHLPNPTPDNHVETRFEPDGAATLMMMRIPLPDAQTRAAMLATGMEASYERLDRLF